MHYIKTTNYDKFKCIAGDCPMSCCLGWQIVIDDDSLEKYSEYKGDFEKRIKDGIDWEEGCFKQCGERCSMLNENNLCDMFIACGEESLCETCTRYPRHIEEYEGVREYSLSLSCPEAARIILERKEPIEFVEWDDEEDDDFEEFDYLLYTKLQDARDVIFDIIKDRTVRFKRKADLLTEFGIALQENLDNDELFEMDETIERFDKERDSVKGNSLWSDKKHFKMLDKLEVLNDYWPSITKNAYLNWSDLLLSEEEEIQAEQLLMFFFYTYFEGAVYDDMIQSKVLMSVMSVYWIFMIDRGREKHDIIESAYLYAREVEHSDLNLNDLEDMLAEL